MGFIHSAAGGMECMGKSGREQGLEPSLLTLHLQNHPGRLKFSWHFMRNCANHRETRVAPGTQICSVDLQWRARPLAALASVSLLACRRGHLPPQAAVQVCLLAQHVFFSPPWVHLCQAAVAEPLIASAGMAGALGRP